MRGQFWRLQKNIQCVLGNNIFFRKMMYREKKIWN